MANPTSTAKRTRLDARLSETQRELFEKAAVLGGFRNFSHFVISSAQDKAEEVIRQKEAIIASERDATIFFDKITNSPAPNDALKDALKTYNSLLNIQ